MAVRAGRARWRTHAKRETDLGLKLRDPGAALLDLPAGSH